MWHTWQQENERNPKIIHGGNPARRKPYGISIMFNGGWGLKSGNPATVPEGNPPDTDKADRHAIHNNMHSHDIIF
jgi:hypothetical protein